MAKTAQKAEEKVIEEKDTNKKVEDIKNVKTVKNNVKVTFLPTFYGYSAQNL